MTDLKARVDKLRTNLLCGNQRCHQKLATLNVDEWTPFNTMKRAAIRFSKEWKRDEHDVWRYHAISNSGALNKIEIARRLDYARRAHFARLALKSAKARRRAVRS